MTGALTSSMTMVATGTAILATAQIVPIKVISRGHPSGLVLVDVGVRSDGFGCAELLSSARFSRDGAASPPTGSDPIVRGNSAGRSPPRYRRGPFRARSQ